MENIYDFKTGMSYLKIKISVVQNAIFADNISTWHCDWGTAGERRYRINKVKDNS